MAWQVLEWLSFALREALPVLLLLASVLWVFAHRSLASVVAVCGSMLTAVARAMYRAGVEVSSIRHGAPQPYGEQDVVSWLVFMYGEAIGMFAFAASVTWYFASSAIASPTRRSKSTRRR